MTLAAYLLTAIVAWTGLPSDCDRAPGLCAAWERVHGERVDGQRARYEEIAGALARAAGGGASPGSALVALELAALGIEESHLAHYIDEGICNLQGAALTPYATLLKRGNCDEGRAFTVYQVRLDGVLGRHVDGLMGRHVTGAEMIRDRDLTAQVVWALRAAHTTWTCGERARKVARRYWVGNPWASEFTPEALP